MRGGKTMSDNLTAIVILVEDDVDRVCIVPSEQATFDNLSRLREQVRASGVESVRIQRITYAGEETPFSTIENVSQQLSNLLDNHNF